MNHAAAQVQESPAPPADSTAARIATRFLHEQRFQSIAPEELGAAAGVDHLLVRNDGWILSVLAIVDAERDPAKRLNLDRAGLLAAAESLASRRGIGRATVSVVEVRAAQDAEASARLAQLKSSLKTVIRSYIALPSERRVWAQRRELFDDVHRAVRRSLERPDESWKEMAGRMAPAQLPPRSLPAATLGLLCVLVGGFVLEQLFPVLPGDGLDPSTTTLVALGALFRPSMGGGHELYRLLTSTLLHAGLEHILLNGVALLMAGIVLERLIGPAHLLALFALGALGGSAGSLLFNAPGAASVGASGAIMGLFAAALVLTLRLPSGTTRVHLQYRLLRLMVPALLPIFLVRPGDHVDYGAHLGGAMVGFLCGVFLLLTWRKDAARPPFTTTAKTLATVGVALFVVAAAQAATRYPTYAVQRDLLPDDQIPHSDAEVRARAELLVRQYPNDPRSHFYLSAKLYDDGNLQGAEKEERVALDRLEACHDWFTPHFEVVIRANLASYLAEEGRKDEAREIARPVCHLGEHGAVPERLKDFCP